MKILLMYLFDFIRIGGGNCESLGIEIQDKAIGCVCVKIVSMKTLGSQETKPFV